MDLPHVEKVRPGETAHRDTMPRGGFGNLIALPLQHGPRQAGSSVFLDETLNAYPDDQQWAVLESAQRIDAAAVERIAEGATRTGTIVGVRIAEVADEEEDVLPWARPPSGTSRVRRVPGPMPARVSAVLAQRLFLAKDGVPSPLLNQIKRLAALRISSTRTARPRYGRLRGAAGRR